MRILMVCTGNICRSPTAEGVVRQHLNAAGLSAQVHVDSAGTHDYHVGDPPDARSIRTALTRGVDLRNLRARQVQAADFRRFDLILAMDHGHLRWLELQRNRESGASAQLRLFLEFAPWHTPLDMPDPYYGDAAGFDTVFALCESGARGLTAFLRDELKWIREQ